MKQKLIGIYCIENLINGKKYIGKSIDLEKRMYKYHEYSTALNRAINKYGKDAFKRFIVECCKIDILEEREKYYIKEWKTKAPNGYNLTDGGEGMSNPSDETRKRLSEALSGENHPNWGIHLSDETKNNIRESLSGEKGYWYGKNLPDWMKIKIGDCNRNPSEETRMKHSISSSRRLGRKNINASSKYRGVRKVIKKYKNKEHTYWRAGGFRVNGKNISVGSYKTEIEAANAYDKYITENNLPNPLNFPKLL